MYHVRQYLHTPRGVIYWLTAALCICDYYYCTVRGVSLICHKPVKITVCFFFFPLADFITAELSPRPIVPALGAMSAVNYYKMTDYSLSLSLRFNGHFQVNLG